MNYDDAYEHYYTAPSLPNAKQIASAFCESEESFDNFENIVSILDDIFNIWNYIKGHVFNMPFIFC